MTGADLSYRSGTKPTGCQCYSIESAQWAPARGNQAAPRRTVAALAESGRLLVSQSVKDSLAAADLHFRHRCRASLDLSVLPLRLGQHLEENANRSQVGVKRRLRGGV